MKKKIKSQSSGARKCFKNNCVCVITFCHCTLLCSIAAEQYTIMWSVRDGLTSRSASTLVIVGNSRSCSYLLWNRAIFLKVAQPPRVDEITLSSILVLGFGESFIKHIQSEEREWMIYYFELFMWILGCTSWNTDGQVHWLVLCCYWYRWKKLDVIKYPDYESTAEPAALWAEC